MFRPDRLQSHQGIGFTSLDFLKNNFSQRPQNSQQHPNHSYSIIVKVSVWWLLFKYIFVKP